MSRYELSPDLGDYGHLDEFALLARQDYNLGNRGKWFHAFRGGLYGFYSRLQGLITHYNTIHAWIPNPRHPSEIEHHLASIFFCMDSSIECITFALNALGYGASTDHFRDVTSDRELRQISPKDILGEDLAKSSHLPLLGYKNIFPVLQGYWQSKRNMIMLIVEQHDVSKHRETIFVGGKGRDDPPPWFNELLKVKGKEETNWIFPPMAEIILKNNPKSAHINRKPQELKDSILLEDVVDEFVQFLKESGKLAVQDAKSTIKLAHQKFIQKSE